MLDSETGSEAIAKIINEQQRREDMQRMLAEQLNNVNGEKYNGGATDDALMSLMLRRVAEEDAAEGASGSGRESARQYSTDRSTTASPSHNGEEHNELFIDENEENQTSADHLEQLRAEVAGAAKPTPTLAPVPESKKKLTTDEEIVEIKRNFVYISHQLSRIMRAVHVAPCLCEDCAPMAQKVFGPKQLNDPMSLLIGLFPNASPQQLHTLAELAKCPRMPSGTPPAPASAPHLQKTFGASYMNFPGGGKQLSQVDRRMVAEYAKIHGAVAAAKKFGVPPPVSTYYKKDSSSALNSAGSGSIPQLQKQGSANGSPGPSMPGEVKKEEVQENAAPTSGAVPAPVSVAHSQSVESVVASPALNGLPSLPLAPNAPAAAAMFAPAMVDMLKMNSAAHATGSPGFLRGRGRGRPKLIGDELDADLVEYMVSMKQSDPHGHLTASQALQIAKQYILEKAPGLLEEHGGHVKLKLTWAMKLVSRIAERQKEIELGLPAGTLSNMGRHQLQNLPGGNFMADMMAQNILSQHMMFGAGGASGGQNGSGVGAATAAQIALAQQQLAAQNNMRLDDDGDDDSPPNSSVNAPEIVNIKELNLPFLSSLFGDSAMKNGEHTGAEGEMGNDDENMDDE